MGEPKHQILDIISAIKKAKIIHHSDGGHGWFSVPVELLQILEIHDQISPYSYLRGKRAYLEEDGDASILIGEIRKYIPEFSAPTSYTDKRSPIRNYGIYEKELAELNLKTPESLIGITLYQANSTYLITGYRKPFFHVTQDGGSQAYRVKEGELSKYFITEEMKKRKLDIEKIHEFLKDSLQGLNLHFYTTDNVSVQIKSSDDLFGFVSIHLDYVISNADVGILKINKFNFKKIVDHSTFVTLAKNLHAANYSIEKIEKVILDL